MRPGLSTGLSAHLSMRLGTCSSMRLATGLAMALALLSSACTTLAGSGGVTPLPAQARVDASRFIVVTVRNVPRPQAQRAGSTPRGYDAAGAYGVTAAASQTVLALEHAYGLREISAWPIASLHVHCIVFRLPPSAAQSALLAELGRDPRVDSAQPLNQFTTEGEPRSTEAAPGAGASAAGDHARPAWMPYNDPYAPLQRALRELDVTGAQRQSLGAGVRIAIVDTGVDFEHPDLRDRVVAHSNFVDRDASQFLSDRHGTQVAGVIAAVANNAIGIVGIAPEARLLVYKACWQPSRDAARAVCNSFTLAQALEAALLARADIVNLSLAGPRDPLLARLVREGQRHGMLFVGAVAPSSAAGFPTALPGVLAVASAEDGPAEAGRLLAPGRDILTLTPGGHYDFASGSSLATAQVSGILALMIAGGRRLPAADAERILAGSAESGSEEGSIAATDRPPGMIDACRALVELTGRGVCRTDAGSFAGVRTRVPAARR